MGLPLGDPFSLAKAAKTAAQGRQSLVPPDNILFWLFHRHLGMGPAVGVVILDA